MVRARSCHVIAALAVSLASVAAAQEGYTPSPENLKARAWFQEARFGLFIHWGVYAVAGDGEWVMHNKRITVPEYERDFPPAFNPVRFDPAAWVAMAKAAGMKYITITSKHHDGFAMWDSKVSDYDVVERTPFPRGRTGRFSGREDKGDWNAYLDYMDAQLRELLTGYGEIGGIWFDGGATTRATAATRARSSFSSCWLRPLATTPTCC